MEKVKYWISIIWVTCATAILGYIGFLFALVSLGWILVSIMFLIDALIFSSMHLLYASILASITAYMVMPTKWRKLYEN